MTQNIEPENLLLSQDESILYFTSDETLYALNLKEAGYEE
jgi:hypothetical protein